MNYQPKLTSNLKLLCSRSIVRTLGQLTLMFYNRLLPSQMITISVFQLEYNVVYFKTKNLL